MSDWDTDSEEETQTKSTPKKGTTQVTNDWDASDASDDEQAKQPQTQTNNQNDCAQNGTNKALENESKQHEQEIEKLKKMQKKMQNYKKKQKRKNKKKNKKKQAPPQPQPQPMRAKQDEINSSDDSSSSSANNNNNNNKKMESYEERMRTDNDILFEGHKTDKNKKQVKAADKRIMLSGNVTLKQFPLGSSHDCDNLATQISALLNDKLFEDAINTNDIFLFYKKLLSSPVLEKLDMVDAKELTNKMNSLLTQKQKAWHKMKNPKNKKKKKPQWIVADKFAAKQSKKTGHVDGQFDADEFSLFD